MGTRWSAGVDVDTAVDLPALRHDLAAAVAQVDDQMSPWKPNSDLMRMNHAPVDMWVDLPAEILAVLDCALDICRQSAGAFDPGVGAVVDAWGLGTVRDAPDAVEIRAARETAQRPTHGCLELDCPAGHGHTAWSSGLGPGQATGAEEEEIVNSETMRALRTDNSLKPADF